MLKKIANIAVMFVLLVSTGGISLTRHYCGESLVSSSLFSTPEKCCDNGCSKCHNELSFNKLTDEFTSSNSGFDGSVHTTPDHFVTFALPAMDLWSAKQMPTVNGPRKFLVPEAGAIPAFIGSFRC